MNVTDRILKFHETVMRIWNETYYPVINDTGGGFDLENNFHIIPARTDTRIDVNREFHSGYWDHPIDAVA